MKCSFCGSELTAGADFCLGCGMILSLGGVTAEPEVKDVAEAQTDIENVVPEYTPNVFKAMDFEEEENVPAMELEVTDEEETAEVVEIIPEYTEEPMEEAVAQVVEEIEYAETAEQDPEEKAEEPAEAPVEEEAEPVEEEFAAPEYDPNAAVSEEFMREIADAQSQHEEFILEDESVAAEYEAEAEAEAVAEEESEGEEIAVQEDLEAVNEAVEESYVQPAEDAYPVYVVEENETVPEEKLTEDESLFAALFEDDEAEKLEDITPTEEKPVKTSKNNFASVAVLIVVLVGVVLAGGYVFKNVLPKVVDNDTTTTAATEEVDATAKEEKTTEAKTTTKTSESETKETASKETTTKEAEAEQTTTKESTTKETTTKETTTKAPETTEDSSEVTVVEPSEFNVDEIPFFPTEGDISIKASPSATAVDMVTHPWGYPVYAYAKQGNYYYVHSPYLDYMGWVYSGDIYEYEENTTTAAPEQEATEQEDTPEADSSVSYVAMIGAAEGLNFRTGPGYDYSADIVVPGGFYVRVTAESAENPGWVYVTVEDDRYPYGTPSGWVLEEYLY